MEGDVSTELRACVARNQGFIDCLLKRRANDERRIDLYQRTMHSHGAQRRRVEKASAALQQELMATLESVYTLESQLQTFCTSKPGVLLDTKSAEPPTLPVDPVQQLRTSLCETQRFNDSLRVEVVRQSSRCDELRRQVFEAQQRCGAIEDSIAHENTRSVGQVSSAVGTSLARASHMKGTADDESTSIADALLMDTTQFYQRAFAAARDAVVEYIALQDELRRYLQRAPLQSLMGTSFEASMLNSVVLFANTYAQLRRREELRYEEVLRTATQLLRESKEEASPM